MKTLGPRRRGEAGQQYMDRIREARGLPPLTRENLFEQVGGARCLIDRGVANPEKQRQMDIAAFMAIFHPEVSDERVREMMRPD